MPIYYVGIRLEEKGTAGSSKEFYGDKNYTGNVSAISSASGKSLIIDYA